MAKLPARLTGAFLLGSSCGSTLIHREIWVAAHHGPPQAIEFVIGLLTFVLASTGLLLLIQGSRLFGHHPEVTGGRHDHYADVAGRLAKSITLAGRAFDTRDGVAMMQARHAIASAGDTTMRSRSSLAWSFERERSKSRPQH